METFQGSVSNCQHTLQVSSGNRNNNYATSTTYIALFRVNNHAVEFRTNRPNSVSDGDQVIVAGVPTRSNSLRAYALRNVNTGEVTNVGILGNIFALIFVPIVLGIFTAVGLTIFGKYGLVGGIALIAFALVYFVRQIVLTRLAIGLVKS